MADISNTDDVIDSRDVIARIEELEENGRPFVAGWNMPGYLPDNEPATFDTFKEACEYILGEIDREIDDKTESLIDAAGDEEREEINENIADLTRVTEELSAITAAGFEGNVAWGHTVGRYHYWITANDSDVARELATLRKLADEASPYAEEWEHGETLIRDSYFKEYAQGLAEDCSPFPSNSPEGKALAMWPYRCIDWDQATRELRMDYTSVDFDGVTYWIR
jgi:hypothetical protein